MELYRDTEERNAGFRQVLKGAETGIDSLTIFGHAADALPVLPILEHRHRDKIEILVVRKGMRRVCASGVEYTLYGDQAFVVRADELHASLEVQPAFAEVLWFQADLSAKEGFLGLPEREAEILYTMLSSFSGRLLELQPELPGEFAKAFRLLCQKDPLALVEGHAVFVAAVVQLMRRGVSLQALSPDIDRAKQYILLHIKEAIDTDELLMESGLSIGEFRKKFASQIGCTPREYINRQKVEQAKNMLLHSGRSIADIAYEYHFSSASFFRMSFKKETGLSPEKYRKKMLKQEKPQNR